MARLDQAGLPADSDQRQVIVDAEELPGQLLAQDAKRSTDGDGRGNADDAGGGVSLKDGVSKDRMVSVQDPEMRHGHKSKGKHFDGHKAAVVVDTDSRLITAVDVLPGNVADNLGELELVEEKEASAEVPVVEAMGETAYGDGVDYYTFTTDGRYTLGLEVREQSIDLDSWLEDADGNAVIQSGPPADPNKDQTIEWLKTTIHVGTYYIKVEAMEDGQTDYYLRCGLTAPEE